MSSANFRAVFPPSQKRHRAAGPGYSGLLKDSFTLPTLMLLGGLGQGLLSLILPARYALLPLLFLLLRAVSVIPGRTSAQLPSTSYDPLASSERASSSSSPSPFGSKPASKGVVVFHLGIRFNHPLGPLSPSAKEVADQFQACHGDLLKRAREYGCLGATTWHGDEAARNNTLLIIYYFRDVDGLNRFAHDGIHRHTWGWFNRTVLQKRGHKHIGIFHEAFCAPAGGYETIYVNMPPELMGAGYASVENEATGEEEWVRTVVDASSPVWRSQMSRMGKDEREGAT